MQALHLKAFQMFAEASSSLKNNIQANRAVRDLCSLGPQFTSFTVWNGSKKNVETTKKGIQSVDRPYRSTWFRC